MTPKQKAKELTEKFFKWYGDEYYFSYDKAKECAIICVKEIIREMKELDITFKTIPLKYWQEVKQEIKKYDSGKASR